MDKTISRKHLVQKPLLIAKTSSGAVKQFLKGRVFKEVFEFQDLEFLFQCSCYQFRFSFWLMRLHSLQKKPQFSFKTRGFNGKNWY